MPSTIEENKALVRRFFAAIENSDFHVFDEIVAPDYDDHLGAGFRTASLRSTGKSRTSPLSRAN
jgi:ketosteroid isomerase-like protein